MASRSVGVSGTAVLLGAVGIYLVYAGVTDPEEGLIGGVRSLLRGDKPTPKATAGDETLLQTPGSEAFAGATANVGAGGDLGLVGNALAALPKIRAAAPGVEMGGRAERPSNPNSDHPRGLAIDVMTRDDAVAQRVIRAFKGTRGAHYWIWNGRLGDVDRLWASYPYTKFGGHYDHVHLSWR